MGSAVVLIDLQNDFLSQTGFLKTPISTRELLPSLQLVVEAARRAGHSVIWVKSHYPPRDVPPTPLRPALSNEQRRRHHKTPMNSDILAGGHHGRRCCVEGSHGAELHPKVEALVHAEDIKVIKTISTHTISELSSRFYITSKVIDT